MTGRILRLWPILAVVALAACGGGGGTKTTTTTTAGRQISVRAYFLRDGKVQPVLRTVATTKAPTTAAYSELLKGPTSEESKLGLTSAVPSGGGWTLGVGSDGVLGLSSKPVTGGALAQIVYTLTQFRGQTTVKVNGTRYTRGSFEDLTPAILVELPLPFESVTSPLRLAGSSNTYEATFQYELRDATGKIVAKHFVTATSGNGFRGTYDVTIPFTVAKAGPGTLTVYENDAATGKVVHRVDIPLTLTP